MNFQISSIFIVLALGLVIVYCDKNEMAGDRQTEPSNALEKRPSTFGKRVNSKTDRSKTDHEVKNKTPKTDSSPLLIDLRPNYDRDKKNVPKTESPYLLINPRSRSKSDRDAKNTPKTDSSYLLINPRSKSNNDREVKSAPKTDSPFLLINPRSRSNSDREVKTVSKTESPPSLINPRKRSSNRKTTPITSTTTARSLPLRSPTKSPAETRNRSPEKVAANKKTEKKRQQQNLLPTSATSRVAIPTSHKPRSSPTTRKSPNVPAIDSLLNFEFPTAYPKPLIPKLVMNKTSSNDLICPKPGKREFQWFPLPCNNHKSCNIMGKNYRCCKDANGYKTCVKGVFKPLREPTHNPILGVVPVKCPKTPLAELFWDLNTCETDADCWPRVCCPDGRKKYCRSASPEFRSSSVAIARSLASPFETMSSYIQCTPPPAPGLDYHPRNCNSTVDCFPNLCCQEAGKRHCRPPKRSILTFFASNLSDRIQKMIFNYK